MRPSGILNSKRPCGPQRCLNRMNRLLSMQLRYILDTSATSPVVQFSSVGYRIEMADLFTDPDIEAKVAEAPAASAPLADRLRPGSLGEVVGQEHLTGPDGAIGRMVAAGKLASMILWGPP